MKCVNVFNRKNKYCSHCEHCDYAFVENCRLKMEETPYWHRCKDFKWRHEYLCRIFRDKRIRNEHDAHCPFQQADGTCNCENCVNNVVRGMKI